MDNRFKNATLEESLGNLVGEKGLRTDVSVSIAPAAIPIGILIIFVGVIGGILVASAIQKAIAK